MVIRHSALKRLACLAAALPVLWAGLWLCPADASAPEKGKTRPGQNVHGPLVSPDGRDYDEWKGIVYSPETVFNVAVSWFPYASKETPLTDAQLIGKDYRLEPAMPNSRFEIVSAEAEPVGGEMKLRSGGYVSIIIKGESTVDFQYSLNPSGRILNDSGKDYSILLKDIVSGVRFSSPFMRPFDLHTGISFLNYFEDPDADSVSPLEATDSGFVESRVSWNGRNYRILARQDHRNLGSTGWQRDEEGDRMTVHIANVRTEIIYSFRVPADYDGLALCIPKFLEDNARDNVLAKQNGGEMQQTELYADILTGSDGSAMDMDYFWFVKVSDLLEHFKDKRPE